METTIRVGKTELLAKLQVLGKISQPNNRAALSAGWFRFALGGGSYLSVTATDAIGSMTARVACHEITGDVDFCVDSRIMLEILPQLPEQELVITDNGGATLQVEYLTGNFEIPKRDAGLFFEAKFSGDDFVSIPIAADTFAAGIKQTIGFTSANELRPVMTAVLVEFSDGKVTFVGSDGHTLAIREFDSGYKKKKVSAPIPATAAKLILTMIERQKDDRMDDAAVLAISGKSCEMSIGSYKLTYRLAEGKYPNYRSVIPEHRWTAGADRRELAGAIRRTTVFSPASFMAVLNFTPGSLEVACDDLDNQQSGREDLPIDYSGDDMTVALNGKKLTAALDTLDDSDVRIQLSDPGRAVCVVPAMTEGITLLLMPYQIPKK